VTKLERRVSVTDLRVVKRSAGCAQCGGTDDGAGVCAKCGAQIRAGVAACPQCGGPDDGSGACANCGAQIRARAASIEGHAAVFDALSEDLGGFREKIARGAFAESIGRDDVRALWNHDPNYVLGRSTAGTLRMTEDARGLLVQISPPDTTWARDLMKSIERGDVSQMSFAFQTEQDAWSKVAGAWERTLLSVRVFDVSPVTYPAYPQTDVGLRGRELGFVPAPPVDWIPHLRARLALAEAE
jgi:HK97 family phage prohead protease